MPVTPLQRKKINQEIAGARSTLAQKVLETVESAVDSYCNCGAIRGVSEHRGMCRAVSADLAEKRVRELFQREGIEVDPTST